MKVDAAGEDMRVQPLPEGKPVWASAEEIQDAETAPVVFTCASNLLGEAPISPKDMIGEAAPGAPMDLIGEATTEASPSGGRATIQSDKPVWASAEEIQDSQTAAAGG